MAENGMSFRQRAVFEFLVKEEIPAAKIRQRLQRNYLGGVFGLSIIKHVTLQKIVAHEFQYDHRNFTKVPSFLLYH